MVSLSDFDERLEMQAHCVTGRTHEFALSAAAKVYIFTCSGLFLGTAQRDVQLKPLGGTSLRDARLYLCQKPFDLAAPKATGRDEQETETFELTEHTA